MRPVPDDDTEVREILERAGPRRAVPEEDLRAISGAMRAAWERKYAKRRRPAWRWLAVAAVLALALTLTWWLARRPAPVAPEQPLVARVDHVTGATDAAAGETLPPGAVVTTPAGGRLALTIAGRSLRLDSGTRVRLGESSIAGGSIVELQQGAVYLDSSSSHAPLTIRTAVSDFTPEGTQFEVRLIGSRAQLRVREGVVRVDTPGRTMTANAGEEVIVHAGGTAVRGRITPWDPSWNWVLDAAPRFDIEGRTLRAFLEWTAREQGRTLRFAGRDVEQASETTTLHGSVTHLDLDGGLQTVMLSTELDARAEDGELVVRKASRKL